MDQLCGCRKNRGALILPWRGMQHMVCTDCARRIDAIVFPYPALPPSPPRKPRPCDCGGSLAHEGFCASLDDGAVIR